MRQASFLNCVRLAPIAINSPPLILANHLLILELESAVLALNARYPYVERETSENSINIKVIITNCGNTANEVFKNCGNRAAKNNIGFGLVAATKKPSLK